MRIIILYKLIIYYNIKGNKMSGINEALKVRGDVSIILRDENGNIKSESNITNLVVTVGRQHIASRMAETGRQNQMSHMQIGSNTTVADPNQTTLLTPLSTRVALATAGGVVSSNTVQYSATFGPSNGTGAVTEAGIFNASTAGTMLCRTVFPVQNKSDSDSLTITWTISFLAS
jgi:hypothetical protein